jgi:hypothetical protein
LRSFSLKKPLGTGALLAFFYTNLLLLLAYNLVSRDTGFENGAVLTFIGFIFIATAFVLHIKDRL